MLKRRLVIALAVLAAAALAGGAYASTRGSSTNARQAFLNDAAKRLHVTPAQLKSALTGALHDRLNAAVKAGKLTQAQANAIEQRVKANGGVPFFGGSFLHRHLAPWGFEAKRGAVGGAIAAAAKYLGLNPRQLRSQLRAGKSLAQIAKAKGKTTAGLENAITAAVTARLDKAVAANRITRAQEKKLLSRLSSRLDALVNAKPGTAHGGAGWGPPPGAPGGPPPGGPWGGPGGPPSGGPPPGAAPWGRPGGHPGSYVPVPRAGAPA
jgi:hypothetical protein